MALRPFHERERRVTAKCRHASSRRHEVLVVGECVCVATVGPGFVTSATGCMGKSRSCGSHIIPPLVTALQRGGVEEQPPPAPKVRGVESEGPSFSGSYRQHIRVHHYDLSWQLWTRILRGGYTAMRRRGQRRLHCKGSWRTSCRTSSRGSLKGRQGQRRGIRTGSTVDCRCMLCRMLAGASAAQSWLRSAPGSGAPGSGHRWSLAILRRHVRPSRVHLWPENRAAPPPVSLLG